MDLSRISYDPGTGEFRWVRPASNRVRPGDIAGALMRNGYITISLDGTAYLAHRLAWFIVHGEWPSGMIDHKNRCRTDNRISNLRDVPVHVNTQNTGVERPNRYGRGVSKVNGKYVARIRCAGKLIRLGVYESPEDAASAYARARELYHAEALTV